MQGGGRGEKGVGGRDRMFKHQEIGLLMHTSKKLYVYSVELHTTYMPPVDTGEKSLIINTRKTTLIYTVIP